MSLAIRWEEHQLVVENYLTGAICTLSASVISLLDGITKATPISRLADMWRAIPKRNALISQLIKFDVLVVEGSELDLKEKRIAETWVWGHNARYYHFSTNVREFESEPAVQRAALTATASERPAPPAYKETQGGAKLSLGSADFGRRTGGFWDVLRSRRTCRSFRDHKIDAEDLSDILLWTWGKLEERNDPPLGRSLIKTSPSGGARHPVEVYPVVLSVAGVEPGIYHYSVREHALEPIRPGTHRALVVDFCSGQDWVGDTAAVFFMTAVLDRSMWKYRDAHAYRVLQLDAGHLGQTFHLTCTALGLAPFSTAATRNGDIERVLGLDGVSEIVIYTVAVGTPSES